MKFLLIYITILLTTAVGIAQDIQVTTTVNKNKVGLQENFEYKIEISGKSMSLPDPVFPELDEFYIISGPNSSTNIQYINGKMSSSKTYSYYLQPQKLGKINLPQVKLEYNGKIYTSNSIQIEVIKGAKAKSQNQKQQQTTSRKDEDLLGESLYLKAELNKRTAFVNEPITVTYKLYFRVSVRSFNWEKIPSNPGFWMEEFEIPSQPPIENEIINGMTYQVATLRKIALFPTKSGELLIEPLSVSVDALVKSQRKSRSLFDSFFDDPFGRTVRKVLSSKAIPINIKPLPEKNKPINFSGAVGNFSLSVTSDKAQLKVNEAASVKISVSGEGNIKLVKAPALKTPPDMEVYDPKEKTNINRDNNRISGNKIVEYIIVPRYEGNYSIKPVSFSYFDPKTKTYKTLTSSMINLSVLPGDAGIGGMASSSNLTKQEVELLGQDIRFIKESTQFYKSGVKIYENGLYLAAYLIPLFGLAGAWHYRKQREILLGNAQLARRRKAGKIAARHLSKAKKALKPNLATGFYKAMSLALQGFVSDKLNIQMTDFNSVSVFNNLNKTGVGEDEIKEYQACLDESDFRQFSGSDSSMEEMKSFFDRAKKILTKLEKYI